MKQVLVERKLSWIRVLTCAMESLFTGEGLVALGALASRHRRNWRKLMTIHDLLFLVFGILLFLLFLFVLFL